MQDEITHSDTAKQQDQELLTLLENYPTAEAAAGYFDQALLRATHEGTRRQRNRWWLTGFGSAVAAGLAVWIVGGFFFSTADVSPANTTIPGIVMTLEEPRTVNLVFASAEALDAATLTVLLPVGLEMSGFPGQREIVWQTSLNAGKNLLPLNLIATSPLGGEVLATLEHSNRGRTFRLRVDAG